MDWFVEKIKVLLLGLLPAALASYFGALAVPFGLLVLCNLIDYCTGIAAAPQRQQPRSSEKGFRGIAKKICMWLLVVVGVIVDLLLAFVITTLGWQTPFQLAIACVVCLWLLVNEILSILENIADLGVQVPFLAPLIQWVKHRVEQSGKVEEEEGGAAQK